MLATTDSPLPLLLMAAPLLLGFAAIWWLLPTGSARPRNRLYGGIAGAIALLWLELTWFHGTEDAMHDFFFCLFASAALASAVCMITTPNPVYAALWFALVTLSCCGLFLLQTAPFLAAATIIVYAGAIIVTFLFVIMMARQSGTSEYDRRSREPLLSTLATLVLAVGMMLSVARWSASFAPPAEGDPPLAGSSLALPRPDMRTNPFSKPERAEDYGTLRGLGRSLFGDYLFAVELAGTLLMVATIGAIGIAPRRRQGTL